MKTDPEARGIYLRGTTYWFQPPMRRGIRHKPVTLQTTDFKEAISRAQKVRGIVALHASEGVRADMRCFIAYCTAPQRRIYSRNTGLQAGYILKAFIESLPRTRTIDTITTQDVQRYYDAQFETKTPVTAWRILIQIRAFLRWATKIENKTRQNAAEDVKATRPTAVARFRFCTREQRDLLIDECQDETMKLILMLGFHAGMRKNEIVEAVPWWFNLDQKFIDMTSTKTMPFNRFKRGRTVPLRDALYRFLREYGLRDPFLVKPDVTHGKSTYRYDFDVPFRKYVRSKGLPWVHPHTMRHTFASLLVMDGASLFKVAKWMGDTTKIVEQHYAHLTPKDDDIEERPVISPQAN